MSKYDVPDCLVLKFEEVEKETKLIDTTVYVFYDKRTHNYFVRGRRRWSETTQSCTYSFQCEFAKDLADFLEYTMCDFNTVNEVLYNYDNLPVESNDVTFDFLHDYDHKDYEISGYNNIKLRRKGLLRKLRILRNVFNFYK
jgi:hypothetical protein